MKMVECDPWGVGVEVRVTCRVDKDCVLLEDVETPKRLRLGSDLTERKEEGVWERGPKFV